MKKVLITVLFMTFIFVSACAATAFAQDNASQGQTSAGQKWQNDKAENHFMASSKYFLKKEYHKSADEMRKGSEILKDKAKSAAEDTKQALNKDASELDQLADNIEKGTEKSVKNMKDLFARADNTLAKYYHEKASESYAKKEYKNAGHELKAAAAHFKEGITWAGQKGERGTETAIEESRRLGDNLVKGTKVAAGNVEKGMSSLGDEIKKFWDKVRGTKTE